MASSYPNRTAPVLRGAWILDNVTGTPPAPPPPNVEALKETPPGAKLDLREQMAAHSTQKSCFACHGSWIPWACRWRTSTWWRWREKDRLAETAIDASGVLPDGTKVNGPIDLRNALMKNPDQFVQTLTTKLMIYATGRPMEWSDMPGSAASCARRRGRLSIFDIVDGYREEPAVPDASRSWRRRRHLSFARPP